MPQFQVTRTQVVQLIAFDTLTASLTIPSLEEPLVDDTIIGQYMVGMCWSSTIRVRLVRLGLDPSVVLTARSRRGIAQVAAAVGSGDSVLTVTTGADAGMWAQDAIDIYWGTHRVGTLLVHLYRLLTVNVRACYVRCVASPVTDSGIDRDRRAIDEDPQTARHYAAATLTYPFQIVNAIWRTAGIQFMLPQVNGVNQLSFDGLHVMPRMAVDNKPRLFKGNGDPTPTSPPNTQPRYNGEDLAEFFSAEHGPGWEARKLNLYMVHRVQGCPRDVWAFTYPLHPWDADTTAPHPCIIVPLYVSPFTRDGLPDPDNANTFTPAWPPPEARNRPLLQLGLTLAHEFGHYIGLRHPRDSAPINTELARRLLMFNNTNGDVLIPQRGLYTNRTTFNDGSAVEARNTVVADLL